MFLLSAADGIEVPLFSNVLLVGLSFIRTSLMEGEQQLTGNCWHLQVLITSVIHGIRHNGLVSHINRFYAYKSVVLKWLSKFMLLTIVRFRISTKHVRFVTVANM